MANAAKYEPMIIRAFDYAFDQAKLYLTEIISNLKTDKGLTVVDEINIGKLDSTIRMLYANLSTMGFIEIRRTQIQAIDGLVKDIQAEAKMVGISSEFTTANKQAIIALIRGADLDMQNVVYRVGDEVSKLLRASMLVQTDIKELIKAIALKLDSQKHQAMTVAITTLMSFNSSVSVQHALSRGVKWFLYRGPKDELTRTCCRQFVGSKVTPEILFKYSDAFERTPGLVPFITWRGGWNCRHHLSPLPPGMVENYPTGPIPGRGKKGDIYAN